MSAVVVAFFVLLVLDLILTLTDLVPESAWLWLENLLGWRR